MSQLLTALKQSDKNNEAQSSASNTEGEAVKIVHPMRAVKAQQSQVRWLMPIVIALLPAASIVAYKIYQQQIVSVTTTTTQQPSLVTTALPPSVLQAPKKQVLDTDSTVTNADVIFMTYPDIVTEPLPINDGLYVASPAYQSLSNVEEHNSEPREQDRDLGPSDDLPHNTVQHVIKATSTNDDPYKLDNLDLSALSPDIAAKLKSAIVATTGEHYQDSEVDRSNADRNAIKPHSTVTKTPKSKVIPIGLLPAAVQQQLPKMNFNQHIYSSTPAKRWVKVNGNERHQGDMIAPGVKLVKIESRDVILTFDGYEISMPALSEW
ncbi:general secretion pathway protein GspB [Photobacterium piscicola]|uniref:General secretion pathway protein GspB n=1 Tax=Photobacterium piscicola TaxID=1378299 RepID=A0ABU6LN60_9GAMM|nr:general secretion pathway protein GspB [Photobacterium piscicola]MEC6899647.1 general secretion pathway protein GspB [Photobacterium piscicola]